MNRASYHHLTLAMLLASASFAAAPPPPAAPSAEEVNAWFEAVHLAQLPVPPLLRHADLTRELARLQAAAPELFTVEEIGASVEGRALRHVMIGKGSRHVLLWSQMHGDEPTATSALLDLFELFRQKRDAAAPARILSALTLHVVPMLNPDGAERFTRRNAQNIDINRDALAQQTPEGRALKSLRDKLQPFIGFNLHNQSWRMAAGKGGRPATISLLAAAFDPERSDNPGRVLAKKVCAVIRDALEPTIPGQVGRYDDEFEVRAFGDNMTKWGTPSVLIETGPYPSVNPDAELIRLNFVALVQALDALATGRAEAAQVQRYESLPMNDTSGMLYLLLRGATVFGADGKPFTADVGIAANRVIRGKQVVFSGKVDELGDLRVFNALTQLDAKGLTVVPLPKGGAKPGAVVKLGDLKRQTISLGAPADLMVLTALERGTYKVERVYQLGK